MLKRMLYRFIIGISLLIAADIAGQLDETSDIRGAMFIPFGVWFLGVIFFVIIFPVIKERSFFWGLKWEKLKRKRFEKKVRESGMSEGEYIMTILPEEDVSFIESHSDDLPLQENYIKYLAHDRTITFTQSDALVKYVRFLHTDRSEGAYVFTHLSDYDIQKITEHKDIPVLQKASIDLLVDFKTITPAQGEALWEYCRKLSGKR